MSWRLGNSTCGSITVGGCIKYVMDVFVSSFLLFFDLY